MKVSCIEVPLPARAADGSDEVRASNSRPLQLSALAAAAERAGATVEMQPSRPAWAALLPEGAEAARRAFVAQTVTQDDDVIILTADSFNWPLVASLLGLLDAGDQRVVVAGSHATLFPRQVLSYGAVDAVVCDGFEGAVEHLLKSWDTDSAAGGGAGISGVILKGEEDAARCVAARDGLLSQTGRMPEWPRWDEGLSSAEVFGFPLESRPHPLNLPLLPPDGVASLAEWLGAILPLLDTLREPRLWLSLLAGEWGRELMETLGEAALKAVQTHGFSPLFAVRATADQLLAPSVLPSLGVLEMHRVELLAGAGPGAPAERHPENYDFARIEECVKELQRCGLASKTRLSCVIGLPGEDLARIMDVIRHTTGVAVEHLLPEVKFEWWYNTPGSPLYQPSGEWEGFVNDTSQVWHLREDLFERLSSGLDREGRRAVVGTIEFLRGLHENLKITGPFIL